MVVEKFVQTRINPFNNKELEMATKSPSKKKVAAKKVSAKKKAPAKKASVKKTSAKKKAPAKKLPAKVSAKKKAVAKKAPVKKKAPAKKVAAKKAPVKKSAAGKNGVVELKEELPEDDGFPPIPVRPKRGKAHKLTKFEEQQKQKLLNLRDSLVDAMNGVAKENLRAGGDGSDNSAFGMHQADAGSDAYDRDFALNLLSQEQDALHEIEEALKRIEFGSYGICEISAKKIMHARLEAIPFTRYTVDCQAQIERENGGRGGRRPPVRTMQGILGDGSALESASSSV